MPTHAAPQAPFRVLRSVDDPALARTAPVHATVSTAPFDDVAGTLDDGASYYYVVLDAADQPVSLSVAKNHVVGAVRLGFDDGDPASAPVDVSRSTVRVEPASIPADGLSVATVTIVPRDVFGIPLGTGLSIAADSASLLPGLPLGPVVDHGDGRYTLSVVSSNAGSGAAVITVEGLMLADRPAITYFAMFESSRTIVEQLIDIIALLRAAADANPGTALEQQLLATIDELQGAVDALTLDPPDTAAALELVEAGKQRIEDQAVPAGLHPLLGGTLVDRLYEIKLALGWSPPVKTGSGAGP